MAVSVSTELHILAPQTGTALRVRAGQVIAIVDIEGGQVADLALFRDGDIAESFSPGRTIDYNERIGLRVGDLLFSQRSNELAEVVADTVGVHDMLLSPCSAAMFARRGMEAHPSCHGNLSEALGNYSIGADAVTSTLNIFMDVRVDRDGRVRIYRPASNAGDRFELKALRDLIIGIAACSSELTNDGHCKPIGYALPA